MSALVPRSQQANLTRTRILSAAQQLFAAQGFERTTIRAIAADAEIDASMVIRYFGNKASLFNAATQIDLALPDLQNVPQHSTGRVLAAHFLDRWETPETGIPLKVLLSTSLNEVSAANEIQHIFRMQLAPVIERTPSTRVEDRDLRAALIASQILGFALCRYIFQIPPLIALDRDSAIDHLAPVLQHYLDPENSIPAMRASESSSLCVPSAGASQESELFDTSAPRQRPPAEPYNTDTGVKERPND